MRDGRLSNASRAIVVRSCDLLLHDERVFGARQFKSYLPATESITTCHPLFGYSPDESKKDEKQQQDKKPGAWMEKFKHMDCDFSLRAMDKLYNASFVEFVRNEKNCDFTGRHLSLIVKDYKLEQVVHGIRWLVDGWSIEATARGLKHVFDDWLPELAAFAIAKIGCSWSLRPKMGLVVSYLMLGEPVHIVALFIRSLTLGWTVERITELISCVDTVLEWPDEYFTEFTELFMKEVIDGKERRENKDIEPAMMVQALANMYKTSAALTNYRIVLADLRLAFSKCTYLSHFTHAVTCQSCLRRRSCDNPAANMQVMPTPSAIVALRKEGAGGIAVMAQMISQKLRPQSSSTFSSFSENDSVAPGEESTEDGDTMAENSSRTSSEVSMSYIPLSIQRILGLAPSGEGDGSSQRTQTQGDGVGTPPLSLGPHGGAGSLMDMARSSRSSLTSLSPNLFADAQPAQPTSQAAGASQQPQQPQQHQQSSQAAEQPINSVTSPFASVLHLPQTMPLDGDLETQQVVDTIIHSSAAPPSLQHQSLSTNSLRSLNNLTNQGANIRSQRLHSLLSLTALSTNSLDVAGNPGNAGLDMTVVDEEEMQREIEEIVKALEQGRLEREGLEGNGSAAAGATARQVDEVVSGNGVNLAGRDSGVDGVEDRETLGSAPGGVRKKLSRGPSFAN